MTDHLVIATDHMKLAHQIEVARAELQGLINSAANANLSIRVSILPVTMVGRVDPTPHLRVDVFHNITAMPQVIPERRPLALEATPSRRKPLQVHVERKISAEDYSPSALDEELVELALDAWFDNTEAGWRSSRVKMRAVLSAIRSKIEARRGMKMKWKLIEQAPLSIWMLVRGNSGFRSTHPSFYCVACKVMSCGMVESWIGVDLKRLSDVNWFPTEYVTLKEFEEWGNE